MSTTVGPSIEPTRIELSKSAEKYANRKSPPPYLILTPTLLLTLGILIPFFAAIYLSFTDFTLRSSDYSFIGFDNYVSMFQNPDFWHSLLVTLQYAALCTTVEMLLGIGVALLLNEENPVSKFLRIVLIFPLMIAPVIGTLIWKLMTNPSVGILRTPMSWIGLGDFTLGASTDTAMF